LKLDESVRQSAEIFDHRRKLAKRHEPGGEVIAVPRLELQLGASSLKLDDRRIAFQRHRRLAKLGLTSGGTAVGSRAWQTAWP
jgi:hypothetical protein